jgi:hypothetical protein
MRCDVAIFNIRQHTQRMVEVMKEYFDLPSETTAFFSVKPQAAVT